MIEVKAKLNNAHVSPSKARLVAGAVRGLSVDEALARLPIIHKAAAPIIDKLLKSAVANAADQYEIKHGDLVIKSITVNKGLDLKRWRPAAFGRAHPFKKHFSHIEIVVVAREGVKAKSMLVGDDHELQNPVVIKKRTFTWKNILPFLLNPRLC